MRRLVRTLLALVLGLGLAVALGSPVGAAVEHPVSSPRWQSCVRTLDGVTTRILRTQRSVVVVNQTSRSYARVSFYIRREGPCSLTRKFLTRTARIGRNGTVLGTERKQASGTTPRGTYTITETFGNGPAPTTAMPYHEVRRDDYWVGDNRSRYYNTLRRKADGGFRWWLPASHKEASENLRDYGRQYRYVAVINFNRAPDEQKAFRGFGIFLHVKSDRATAGCVGITEGQMKVVLRYLRPGDRIAIRG